MKIKGMSLFAGGIGERSLGKTNLKIVVANELLPTRAKFYKFYNPKTDRICGDITNPDVKALLISKAKAQHVDFIIATPPCQGASLIGKNKDLEARKKDIRNYLVFHALEIIDSILPSFVLFENVTRFYEILYSFDGQNNRPLLEILQRKYSDIYNISYDVFHTEEYGIPQARTRGILRRWKKNCSWALPQKEKIVTVREAIGNLPSLESGQKSNIKNHYARVHTSEHILCRRHTPTGHSAFENPIFYPKDKNGNRVKGFAATFKRREWDAPAPTITRRNDCISSQSNVHPGRKLSDGTYSDARVLTLRELFILSSIDPDIDLPEGISDSQIRYIVGEGVPPKRLRKIVKGASYND